MVRRSQSPLQVTLRGVNSYKIRDNPLISNALDNIANELNRNTESRLDITVRTIFQEGTEHAQFFLYSRANSLLEALKNRGVPMKKIDFKWDYGSVDIDVTFK